MELSVPLFAEWERYELLQFMKVLRRKLVAICPPRMRMAIAWERRARKNPLHYIADFRKDWESEDEFFQSGQNDVEKLLSHCSWGDTSAASLLEIGCGVGRMTRHFATRFALVTGIDISPTMIRRAKELNPHLSNTEFRVGSGVDLKGIPDQSFDYAVSYVVFQHIPDEQVIYSYIREAIRVLKPHGRFLFQARTDTRPIVYNTYSGASIDPEKVCEIAKTAGQKAVLVSGANSQFSFFEIS